MLYGVIVMTEPEASEYIGISYEDLLGIVIDRLLSDEQSPIIFWRRCCSSVHKQTMSVETCNEIRRLAGVADKGDNDPADLRKKLDAAVNNWYLKGEISLSEEGIIMPSDDCSLV